MNLTEQVEKHPDLKATTEYCLEYEHNEQKWAMSFFAEDWHDAEKKVENIKASLVLLGELDEVISFDP